jgi:hypothetical protein
MARCIPNVIPAAQHHDGEQALLERFRTELPDEFIVIPCLEVPRLSSGRDSEADFVILHPRGPNTGSGRTFGVLNQKWHE